MKYFSLSEILFSLPLTLILGIIFAFIYRLTIAFFICFTRFTELPRYIKTKLDKRNFKFDILGYYEFNNRKIGFIVSEFVNFIFLIFSGAAFTVITYMISDGIPRLYIIALFLIGFFISMRILKKPLELASNLISVSVIKLLFMLIYTALYIPIRFLIKIKSMLIVKKLLH